MEKVTGGEIEKNTFYIFEGAMARMERSNRRLFIAIIITIILLFLSNLAWLYIWNQYDYVDDGYSVDLGGDGIATFVGERGNVNALYTGSETDD